MTRFLLPAEIEMVEAAAYYEMQAGGLGAAFLAKVKSAVCDVAASPEAWPIVRSDIRKRLVHRFPYALLYRLDAEEIVIVGVMHQRRRPDYWLGRM